MSRRGLIYSCLGSLLILLTLTACGQQLNQDQRGAPTSLPTNALPSAVPSAVGTVSNNIPQPVISVGPPLNEATANVESTAVVQRTSTAKAYSDALATTISASATALVVQAPTLTAVAQDQYEALHPKPQSTPVEMNKAYPFNLFTHCGLDYFVDFNGSFWDSVDRSYYPTSIGNPSQQGTMTLVDESHARFDYEGGSLLFVRHTGQKVLAGFCG